jgi:cytochrome c5
MLLKSAIGFFPVNHFPLYTTLTRRCIYMEDGMKTMNLTLSSIALFSALTSLNIMAEESLAQGEVLYKQACATCHDNAQQGAPRPHAPEDWAGRSLDVDTLAKSAVSAPAHMPAKGGTEMESITNLKSIITYMINDVKGQTEGSGVDQALYHSRREGKKLYALHCFSCHDTGENGSPMLGNMDDWQSRLELGREALINSVIQGKGMMIPMGGSSIESREQVGNLVDYMVSTVQDEAIRDSAEMQEQVKLAKQISDGRRFYNHVCFSCHNTGENGTPQLGDYAAWKHRRDKPIDELVNNVISGHGLMPAKGGGEFKSRAQLESVVHYMLSTTDQE